MITLYNLCGNNQTQQIYFCFCQAVRHLSALLLCLAISGQSFLLPVGRLLLQKEPTISDLVGETFFFPSKLLMYLDTSLTGPA